MVHGSEWEVDVQQLPKEEGCEWPYPSIPDPTLTAHSQRETAKMGTLLETPTKHPIKRSSWLSCLVLGL